MCQEKVRCHHTIHATLDIVAALASHRVLCWAFALAAHDDDGISEVDQLLASAAQAHHIVLFGLWAMRENMPTSRSYKQVDGAFEPMGQRGGFAY